MLRFLIFVLFASTYVNANPIETQSFYSKHPVIIELDSSTFDEHIYCQQSSCENAKFVQFYNSKSAMSEKFSVLFKEIATSTATWTGIVKLFTVNCLLDSNKELCTRYGFNRIPVLKYFTVTADKDDLGEKMILYTNASVIISNLMKLIELEYEESWNENWPCFVPIPKEILVDAIWETQPPDTQHVLLALINKPNDFQTFNLLIHAKKVSPDLVVRIVLNGSLVGTSLGITQYPTYMILRRNEKPEYDPFTEKWTQPTTQKVQSMTQEFGKVLGRLELDFYDRYSKSIFVTKPHEDDDFFVDTQFHIYRPDVPSKHSKKPEDITDMKYDGVELQFKPEIDQPEKPVKGLYLGSISNYGAPQIQVPNTGYSMYFCHFMALLTIAFNLLY